MDLIRCPRCAKEIPDVSRFCRRCGCSLAWELAGVTPPYWGGGFDDDRITPLIRPRHEGRATVAQASPRSQPEARRPANGVGAVAALIGIAGVTFLTHMQPLRPRPVATPRLQYIDPTPVRAVPHPRPMPRDPSDWRPLRHLDRP